MRKKTIKCLSDTIFWYALYFLPVLILIIMSIHNPLTSLSSVMSTLGLEVLSDNLIYTTLSSIFGTGGVLPFFVTTDILLYMTYFCSVLILHLFVDFILFIPRLAHKWLKRGYQDE